MHKDFLAVELVGRVLDGMEVGVVARFKSNVGRVKIDLPICLNSLPPIIYVLKRMPKHCLLEACIPSVLGTAQVVAQSLI